MPLKTSRVLVVEDDFRIGQVIEDMIRQAGGRVVGPFASVVDALEQMDELGGVDAAVLDIGLIGEDSYPLASALQATSVPFIFLSGRDRGDLPSGLERAILLTKPVTSTALVDALVQCGALRR